MLGDFYQPALSSGCLLGHASCKSPPGTVLGPPWVLPRREEALNDTLHSLGDVSLAIRALPRARVVHPWHAHISQHAGANGTLWLDQRSCRSIKRKPRELCYGVYQETQARADRHTSEPTSTRVIVKIDFGTPPTERTALVENAVQQRLAGRLQQQTVRGDEAEQLQQRGWTTRLTPNVSFVLILRRNTSHNTSRGADAGLIGPSALTRTVTQQYVSVAEAIDGQELTRVVQQTTNDSTSVPYSMCAFLHATLQVALKV